MRQNQEPSLSRESTLENTTDAREGGKGEEKVMIYRSVCRAVFISKVSIICFDRPAMCLCQLVWISCVIVI